MTNCLPCALLTAMYRRLGYRTNRKADWSLIVSSINLNSFFVLGSAQSCPVLKLLSNKVGNILCFRNAPKKYRRLDAKLETKMIELKRSSSGQTNFRSINSIILKFPQFREGLKEIKAVFEQFGEYLLYMLSFEFFLQFTMQDNCQWISSCSIS